LVKAIQEGLGGIRDVLLDGTQSTYCDIYRHADQPLRRAQGSNVFIAQSPKFVIETFSMVLIAALAYGLSRQAGGVGTALPVLGALVLGAQRLLLILQIGYSSWAGVVSSHGSLADTVKLLDQPLPSDILLPTPAPLPFRMPPALTPCDSATAPTVLGCWMTLSHDSQGKLRRSCRHHRQRQEHRARSADGFTDSYRGEVLVDGQTVTGNSVRAAENDRSCAAEHLFDRYHIGREHRLGVPREAIDRERVKRAAISGTNSRLHRRLH